MGALQHGFVRVGMSRDGTKLRVVRDLLAEGLGGGGSLGTVGETCPP